MSGISFSILCSILSIDGHGKMSFHFYELLIPVELDFPPSKFFQTDSRVHTAFGTKATKEWSTVKLGYNVIKGTQK
jgi:hypothetical protein